MERRPADRLRVVQPRHVTHPSHRYAAAWPRSSSSRSPPRADGDLISRTPTPTLLIRHVRYQRPERTSWGAQPVPAVIRVWEGRGLPGLLRWHAVRSETARCEVYRRPGLQTRSGQVGSRYLGEPPLAGLCFKRCSCQFPALDRTGRDDRDTRDVRWPVTEPCLRRITETPRTQASAAARRRLDRHSRQDRRRPGAGSARADELMRTPGPKHGYQQGGCHARHHRH